MIAVIGTVGVPACYGGFETLVDNLLDFEGEFTVYCSGKVYQERPPHYKSAKLIYLPFNANGASSILYDAVSMLHSIIRGSKVLLVLGVSAGLLLPFIRIFTRRRLITNIDGLEWRRAKWNRFAKWFLKVSERAAVKFSHEIIADNQGIADYVLDEYGVSAHVIAYGGDHVLTANITRRCDGYAFGVCRIEPENNVHLILEAFSKSNKCLKFVGNWSASEYGQDLKQQYATYGHIEMIDPVYDLEQLFELRDGCDFYVHGHSAGGTNPSLVEAMFFAKPIIAFDCIYNRASMEARGFYFQDSLSLTSLIQEGVEGSEEGLVLRDIAESRYTWREIRSRYMSLIVNF